MIFRLCHCIKCYGVTIRFEEKTLSIALRSPLISSTLKNRSSRSPAISKPGGEERPKFDDIYRLYKQRVYWLCLRMVKNPTEAEDLTQDVFIQVYRKMHQFQGRAAFFTWLHRVAVNVALMRLRRRTHHTESLEEMLNPENGESRSLDFLASTDSRLAGTINRVLLARALVCLPRQYRMAFALHDVAGYPHREIAMRMKCSISNSKTNVRRARSKLRKLLSAPAAAQFSESPSAPNSKSR